MPNYSQGKIYKVTCGETSKVYIGSTIKCLSARLNNHKTNDNTCATNQFIDPKIELLEEYPCETKEQLLWREREWYEKTDCINKQRPIITDEEDKERKRKSASKYREENKEKIKQYNSKYKQENKELLNEKFNCECGGKFTKQHKATHLKTKKHQSFASGLKTNL